MFAGLQRVDLYFVFIFVVPLFGDLVVIAGRLFLGSSPSLLRRIPCNTLFLVV